MTKKETIYLETSVISAYFDFKKQDLIRKRETVKFFKESLPKYKVYISDVVMTELAATKDNQQRNKLLLLAAKYPIISFNKEARQLANGYLKEKIIPASRKFDAYHLAMVSVNNVDILVSWNYNHIVILNAEQRVNAFNVLKGYQTIKIEFPTKLLIPKL